MKKAKLILAGIACLAVVGGVYASKAARTGHPFFKTTVVGGLCTAPTTIFSSTVGAGAGLLQTTYYTAAVNATLCPATRIYVSN